MSGSDRLSEGLRAALHELAEADGPGVLERARSRAAARAEQLIEDALLDELLAAAARGPARSAGQAPTRETESGPQRAETRPPQREIRPPDGPEPEGASAWWTYCIMWAPEATTCAARLEGIEPGSCVEPICDGDLAALVSRVPWEEYGDERLRAHLEDLAWVERTARRHEDVLDEALREATVVPLRLCTLYRDRDGVRRLLREHRTALREGLTRVEGCVEWGVKLFADLQAQASQVEPDPATGEGRGQTYLLRRQQERVLSEKASEVRARCVEVVHQRIDALARTSVTNPPQRPQVHGRDLAMLLNGAYLVDRDRTAELRAVIDTLQEEWQALGFSIELTGPWPPYNFVSGAAGVLS